MYLSSRTLTFQKNCVICLFESKICLIENDEKCFLFHLNPNLGGLFRGSLWGVGGELPPPPPPLV